MKEVQMRWAFVEGESEGMFSLIGEQELSREILILVLAVNSKSGGDRQGKNNLPHRTKKMRLMHECCLGVTFSYHWLPFVPQAPISLIGLHDNRESSSTTSSFGQG